MKNFKVFLLSVLLVVTFIAPSFKSYAKENKERSAITQVLEKYEVKTMSVNGENIRYLNSSDLSPQDYRILSATAVAVFVGQILVAFIIDGIITYTTGKSGGQWVADALKWARDKSVKSLHCDNNRVLRAVNRNGCVKYSQYGNWICQS